MPMPLSFHHFKSLAAALPLLLAMSFMAALPARAEEVACSGRDMIAAMAQDDPARLASLRQAAGAEPNGRGLLWRISKEGVAPSWLFGTMHMADPRVTTLPAAAQSAFDGADTLVIETLDVLDPAKMTALMLERPELTMFTGPETLIDLIPEADRAMIAERLAARGVPLDSLRKTKPWLIAALVALPACELQRQAAGAEILDLALAEAAETGGKRLEGLESLADQLEAMAALPMDFHIRGLVETVRLGDRLDDVIETMIVLYRAGEVGMFWPFFEAVLPDETEAGAAGYADFQEKMIVARNGTMADRALPVLARGNVFMAVGALHLPGRDGVVERLRQAGFTVEAMN